MTAQEWNAFNEPSSNRLASPTNTAPIVSADVLRHPLPSKTLREDADAGKLAPVSPTLAEAWQRASPKGIDLILSGHVHLFELFSYDYGRPTQIVAGDGGTNLADPLEGSLLGAAAPGANVTSGESEHQFGYSLLTRHGRTWNLTLKNRISRVLVNCEIPNGRATCQEVHDLVHRALAGFRVESTRP